MCVYVNMCMCMHVSMCACMCDVYLSHVYVCVCMYVRGYVRVHAIVTDPEASRWVQRV